MFDLDLQEDIQKANKEFLDQAMERKVLADQEQEKTVDVEKSQLEKPVTDADFHLYDLMLGVYSKMAKLGIEASSEYFRRLMVQQGLFKKVRHPDLEGKAMTSRFCI